MMFVMRDMSVAKSIQSINSSRSVSDSFFYCLLDLVCITSAAKLYQKKQPLPPRNYFTKKLLEPKTSKKYWEIWDRGLEISEYLGNLCKKHELDVTRSLLWEMVDNTFKYRFSESYEYRRRVSVMPNDFNGILRAIEKANTLVIGEYVVLPRNIEESTDDYGMDDFSLRWKCFKNRKFIVDLHRDSEDIARKIMELMKEE